AYLIASGKGMGTIIALLIGIAVCLILGYLLKTFFCTGTSAADTSSAAHGTSGPAQTSAAPAGLMSSTDVAAPVADTLKAKDTAPAPKAAAAKPAAAKKAPAKKAAAKASTKAPAKKAPTKKAAAKPAAKKAAAKPAAKAKATGTPEMLKKPRAGGADDLKRLKGVGPKLEETLNTLGVYHFDQVASWTKKDIEWVDGNLTFKGRIERDGWVKQAKTLAKGGETEFSKRVKKGDVY
ncbi:MAG: NADH:quinone oxidoreductase, partial [Halocynthiibacter sp.]